MFICLSPIRNGNKFPGIGISEGMIYFFLILYPTYIWIPSSTHFFSFSYTFIFSFKKCFECIAIVITLRIKLNDIIS